MSPISQPGRVQQTSSHSFIHLSPSDIADDELMKNVQKVYHFTGKGCVSWECVKEGGLKPYGAVVTPQDHLFE